MIGDGEWFLKVEDSVYVIGKSVFYIGNRK